MITEINCTASWRRGRRVIMDTRGEAYIPTIGKLFFFHKRSVTVNLRTKLNDLASIFVSRRGLFFIQSKIINSFLIIERIVGHFQLSKKYFWILLNAILQCITCSIYNIHNQLLYSLFNLQDLYHQYVSRKTSSAAYRTRENLCYS